MAYVVCCSTAEAQDQAQPAGAEEALSKKIDRFLAAELPHFTAGRAADGQLLRRLSLDLRGVVPTGEELKAYAADVDSAKFANWTKRFLADPLHQERMVDWYDKTLMQRRPFAQVDRAAWLAWLRETVDQRVPLNTFVERMLTAPWWNNAQRPAARFFLDRSGDPHLIARDLGRVLLGRDMQCAQCHDHPLVDEYKQFDYHGLLAFVSCSALSETTYKDDKGADQKSQLYVERPGADAPFESVFEKGIALRSGPRLPVSSEIFEPYLEPDARLQKDLPSGAFTGVPQPPLQSRRGELAKALIQDQPGLLARNFANRLWALVFGRGLIHPLDMQHADNPPSHPELLELLTTSLIEMQFDVDRFIEQLVLTDAYCRASELPLQPWPVSAAATSDAFTAELSEIETAAKAAIAKLSAELTAAQAADQQADQALDAVKSQWLAAQSNRNKARDELDKTEAAFNETKKKRDAAQTASDAATKKHRDTLSRIQLLDEAHAKLQQALTLLGADDAELKQALATSKTRADAARGEVAALEQAATAAQAAAAAELVALDAARAKVKEMAAALTVQQDALALVDTAFATARQVWAEKHSHALAIKSAIERHEHGLSLVKSQAEARAALTERTTAEAMLAAQTNQLKTLEQDLQQAKEAFAASEKLRGEAQMAVATARDAAAAHEAQLEQLRETLRQLEKATAVVAAPEPLKSAMQVISETLVTKAAAGAPLIADVEKRQSAFNSADEQRLARQQERDARQQVVDTMQTNLVAARGVLDERSAKLAEAIGLARQAYELVLANQRQRWSVRDMRPQSPEQFGLSILRVTGILDAYVAAELAELQKTQPLEATADAVTVAKRNLVAVRQAIDKLRGNVDVFANLFASGVGQTADEFFASPDQALYMSNAGPVFSWSAPSGQNITQRVIAQADNALASADLYMTLLAREPSASEAAFIAEQLLAPPEQRAAVAQEMVWSMLSSVEFRFYR